MCALPIAKAYFDNCGVILVEPFGSTIRLGSIGFRSGSQWQEVGTTKSFFGFDLRSAPGSSAPNSFSLSSSSGVSLDAYAAGQPGALVTAVADAKARLEVKFSGKNAFVVNTVDQTVTTAQDIGLLIDAIRWAYHNRKSLPAGQAWEKKYSVVTAIAGAASVVALSASSSDAGIVIEGSGKIGAPVTIADVSAKMNFTHQRADVEKLIVSKNPGFGYQAIRLDPSVFVAWDRESPTADRAKLRAIDGVSNTKPVVKRPKDFSEWVRSSGLKSTARVTVQLLGPGTAPIAAGTATAVAKNAAKLAKPTSAVKKASAMKAAAPAPTAKKTAAKKTTAKKASAK